MESVRVHRVNFFEPNLYAIRNIVFDEHTSQLAVSRLDFSLEVWDVKNKPFLQTVIPPHSLYSVEAVAWCCGRLFSAGLQGYIIEHNLITQKHKHVLAAPTNCSIWCMGVNKENTLLAAGTEDGHICLYDITHESFELNKLFNKQEGRILCLDWHESSEVIVTGSINSIHVWNVRTGQIAERIMTGHSEKRETIIWCLAVTSDMTIISGDSHGYTSFWDGKGGYLMSSFAAHNADVLALCLSKDESTVYTAGVDPTIIMYRKSQTHSDGHEWNTKWVKSGERKIHTHDVYALQLADEYLVSGGVDTNLTFSKYPPKIVVNYSQFARASYTSVAPKASLLLLKYPNFLEVWKLGKSIESHGGKLLADKAPVKYAILKSKSTEQINCSAISPDGSWIAYSSSLNVLYLFTLLQDDLQPVIKKVKSLPEEVKFCICLMFLSNDKLVLLTDAQNILILACDLYQSRVISRIETNGLDNIHLLAASPDEKFLAVSSHSGKTCIHDLVKCEVYSHIPFYKCPVTTMKFDLESKNLVIAYSDRKIVEYDLQKCRYSDWCRKKNLGDLKDCSPYAFRGIAFVPQDRNSLILYDEDAVYLIDKHSATKPEKKRLKTSEIEVKEIIEYRAIKRYKFLLDLCLLDNGEMLAVEVRPSDIQVNLPPPLYWKKYGT